MIFQVQFRLKQIVDAEPDSKERLLRELEQFAFRGVPDLRQVPKRLDGTVLNPDELGCFFI